MLLPKNNKWKRFWLFAIIPVEIFDVWSTYLNVVMLCGRELNPFVNWVIEKIGAAAGTLVFVPIYKGLTVFSLWLFLTYAPYASRLFFKIFPAWRKIPWLKKYLFKYWRFAIVSSYIGAYLVLAVALSAVIFNLRGALAYILDFS